MNAFDDAVLSFLEPTFRGKKVLLGVTGSIAAYKAPEIARALQKCGAEVRAVMTESATKFLGPLTLEAITRHPVTVSMWEGDSAGTHHITSARWADLFLIAPASANQIAKISLGLAGDALGAETLAYTGPMALAPAMNPAMWNHPETRKHLAALRARGVAILGPGVGDTACGEEGSGRLMEPVLLLREWATALSPKLSPERSGKSACVTLGGTRAAIDPVRTIANRSSGRMGAALAWALRRRGFQVHAVYGPGVPTEWLPSDAFLHPVETTDQLAEAVEKIRPNAELLVAASAALDWSIKPSPEKLKKENGIPDLEFHESRDSLAEWGQGKPMKPSLGFAAETAGTEAERTAYARSKLSKKGASAVFVNPVGAGQGFERLDNEGVFVTRDRAEAYPRGPKTGLAEKIIERFLGEFAR